MSCQLPESLEIHDVSVNEDLDFQRREWTVQRIAWLVEAAVIVAALLGLLGNGPLSKASISDPTGSLFVEYSRFGHWESPLRIEITVQPRAGHLTRLSINRPYLDQMRVESITPQPVSQSADGERITFEFTSDGDQPLTIAFHFSTRKLGAVEAASGLAGGENVQFTQFIFP